MPNGAYQRFSTESVPQAAKLARWNDFGSETISDMTVDPADRSAFQAQLTRVDLGGLGFMWMETTPASARGSNTSVGSWAVPDQDAMLVIIMETGHSVFAQDGWKAEMQPGDMLVRDLTLPWFHGSRDPMGIVMVKLPYTTICSRIGDPFRICGTPLSAALAPVALATKVIRSIGEALVCDPEGDWGGAVSDVILDAVLLACRSAPHEESPSWAADCSSRQAIRRKAQIYIRAHLHDPDLSVTGIANQIGVGVRNLQRAFLESGATPRQYILHQRLDRAAHLLQGGVNVCGPAITEIAYTAGFSDLSYFSRAFARRFGSSPRAFRRERL